MLQFQVVLQVLGTVLSVSVQVLETLQFQVVLQVLETTLLRCVVVL